MAKASSPTFAFKNPEVSDKYEALETEVDFKLRVPQLQWPQRGSVGNFSDITPEVAEQLIKEGYNRIRRKPL
jgi:hypothetical protein